MNRTFRNIKYIFLQTQVIFAFAAILGIILMLMFEGFMNLKNGFQLENIISTASFNIPFLGILTIALVLGSYYQLLCPFYLTFSTTRKALYLILKALAWGPVLELILVSLILLIFVEPSTKATIISSYPGLIGITFIGLSFGELMGVISLRYAKFGRIFPAILGGIAGGVGGFCGSFLADVGSVRIISMAAVIGKYAHIFLIIGIPLYLIANIAVYRILKKLSAH